MGWYLSLSRRRQIFVAVVMTHFFFLIMLGADHWIHRSRVQQKRVSVHTYVAAPPPKPIASVSPSKVATTAPSPKKVLPKKTPPQAAKKSVENDLVSEIEKNLNSLVTVATPIKKPNIEIPNYQEQHHQSEANDSSAAEQIAALLQESLELPEFGEVKIKLSINRFGVLENLEILEAKSQKNGEFLKKRLPELQFPVSSEITSLTVVFRNF